MPDIGEILLICIGVAYIGLWIMILGWNPNEKDNP